MKKIFFYVLVCLSGVYSLATPAIAKKSSNKELVRSFYEQVFIKHQAEEGAKKYLAPDYIQHNPYVPTGRQSFIDYFVNFFKTNPDARSEIKRIIGEGNLVVVHAHSKVNKKDRGLAVVDIFRVENGKIVEHWDVLQAIPEKSSNTNTMF